MRWLAAAVAVGCAIGTADGHGVPPMTTNIHFAPDDPSSLYVGTTFGLLISHDRGCTFYWVCENTVGYGGTFDPTYRIAADGTIYTGTYAGLRVSRDGGCSFQTATAELPSGDPDRIADRYAAGIDLGPTGDVWVATGDSGLHDDVYVSSDGGVTFTSSGLPSDTVRWTSLVVAPSDGARVYVTGAGAAVHLMRRDGPGWIESPLTGIVLGATPVLTAAAVDPIDRETLYVVSSVGPGDRLYRSTDGGMTFAEVLVTGGWIHDVVIRDGSVLVATLVVSGGIAVAGPAYESTDGGNAFAPLVGAPQLACLAESPDGSLAGCGTNWEPDYMAVTRSVDGTAWTKVWRLVELAGALACPPTADACEQSWSTVQATFGTTGPACGAHQVDAGPIDVPPPPPPPAGCCNAGASPSALLALIVTVWLGRRRRYS